MRLLPLCVRRTVALTVAGVLLARLETIHSGPSSAAVAATTAPKSASSLLGPPPYVAASTAGKTATSATRGCVSGLKTGPVLTIETAPLELVVDDDVVAPPPLVVPPVVVVVVGAGAAASGLTTAARRNVTARKLALMLGWRSESTAR